MNTLGSYPSKTVLFLILTAFLVFLPGDVLSYNNSLPNDGMEIAQLKEGFKKAEVIREESGVAKMTITQMILAILRVLTGLVAVIALAALIIGGFMYITSAGDDTRSKTAKKTILYAIIGLLVIGAAALIVNVVIGIYRN